MMPTHFKIYILVVLLIVSLAQCKPQPDSWKGKKCAIVLTYDDALNIHLDQVVPVLDSFGLKGTFYITAGFDGFKNRKTAWKGIAENGHELGNHTFYHPCVGGEGREWVKSDNDLNTYTLDKLKKELQNTDKELSQLDGKTVRTFAYPCGDKKAGGQSYIELIKNDYLAFRGVHQGMPSLQQVNLLDVDAYIVNGQSGQELIDVTKQAMEKGALLVFLFHGVGGEHNINVSAGAHRDLLEFLHQHENDIWNAPLVEVAEYIKANQ